MPSTTNRALKRPAPPATVPAAAQVQQCKLPAGDALRQALALLQLAKVPGSIPALARAVSELHPTPKSWTWAHRDAYAVVFDAICQASGSSARARSGGQA